MHSIVREGGVITPLPTSCSIGGGACVVGQGAILVLAVTQPPLAFGGYKSRFVDQAGGGSWVWGGTEWSL